METVQFLGQVFFFFALFFLLLPKKRVLLRKQVMIQTLERSISAEPVSRSVF